MSTVCPEGCAVCSLNADGAVCVSGKCKQHYVQDSQGNCKCKSVLLFTMFLIHCHKGIISAVIMLDCFLAFRYHCVPLAPILRELLRISIFIIYML